MKNILYILIILLFISCKSVNYLEIYKCKPVSYGSAIHGDKLKYFFDDYNHEIRKIKFKKRKLTTDLNNEINKLKDYLIANGNQDNKSGIYYFAIIKDQDTLYSNSDLQSWKYKDKVGRYKSDILIKHILR